MKKMKNRFTIMEICEITEIFDKYGIEYVYDSDWQLGAAITEITQKYPARSSEMVNVSLPEGWFLKNMKHHHSHLNAERGGSKPLSWTCTIQHINLGEESTLVGKGQCSQGAVEAVVALIPCGEEF